MTSELAFAVHSHSAFAVALRHALHLLFIEITYRAAHHAVM